VGKRRSILINIKFVRCFLTSDHGDPPTRVNSYVVILGNFVSRSSNQALCFHRLVLQRWRFYRMGVVANRVRGLRRSTLKQHPLVPVNLDPSLRLRVLLVGKIGGTKERSEMQN
jgi:hypothetical protein